MLTPAAYRAERAVSSGETRWVVVESATFELHVEATSFVAGLRARDLSVNTERVYAGRVALYLGYCSERGLPWSEPGFMGLKGFQNWLVGEPLPARGRGGSGARRIRSRNSANGVLTAVGEFLRFGHNHGWVPAGTVSMLSRPRYLQHLPAGYSPGEDDHFRVAAAATFRFREVEPGFEALSEDQVAQIVRVTARARDRFLIELMVGTGMRVGEALGLRCEDVHLLASSRALGCAVEGPHVHVRRRRDNANGALAKSRFPRCIPVTVDLVASYTDYQHERAAVTAAAEADMLFVNLFRAPLGRPLSYWSAKDMFDRLAREAGFVVRPHMLRHTAATRWVRAGVPRDVVQYLLGHVCAGSMQPYLHVDDRATRAAVERVANGRGARGAAR